MNFQNFDPMETERLISVSEFTTHHRISVSFITTLNELGLVEIIKKGEMQYIQEESIGDVESMVRLHYGLEINPEGIDAIIQLLKRVESMQQEMVMLKNRLRLYEDRDI
jgi:MerR HTH family regulatory protein